MSNPIIFANIADKVLGVLEKFLDPKQYDIARLKKQDKALSWAEKEFALAEDVIKWAEEIVPQDSNPLKSFRKLHEKNKRYFSHHSGREV